MSRDCAGCGRQRVSGLRFACERCMRDWPLLAVSFICVVVPVGLAVSFGLYLLVFYPGWFSR